MDRHKLYVQKYRKEWETIEAFKGWLAAVLNNDKKAFCKYCKTSFSAKLSDIKRHGDTPKHKANAKPYDRSSQKVIDFGQKQLLENSRIQSKIAMFIATHAAIRSADHLSNIFRDSGHFNFKMHRTKCTAVINNIIGEHFLNELCNDIRKNRYFSLLLDESADITTFKMLGIVVRYFSEERKKIISTFLGLINVNSGTAPDITDALLEYLAHLKLDVQYLCGIGCDNATVMTGRINGVFQLIKDRCNLPNLILVRCVCHSIQLALQKATEGTLPRNLEFLIRETYNWFSHSTLRQNKYKEMYKIINNNIEPKKILKLCDTRWISMEPAVERILSQWTELKTHFEITRLNENCYTAEMLYQMYKDEQNLLYFKFLSTILNDVQTVNKLFESDNIDPTKLLSSLENLIVRLTNKILNPNEQKDFNYLTDDVSDFLNPVINLGFFFEKECNSQCSLDAEIINCIKIRCQDFIIKLIKQLKERLPSNIKILNEMSIFSVQEALKYFNQKRDITNLCEQIYNDPILIQKIDDQWKNLNFLKWEESSCTEKFWAEVNNYKDPADKNPFYELCNMAKCVLSLPHSNAAVERVFSNMNYFKNKLRNRLSVATVNALLQIKFGLIIDNSCCDKYIIPDAILLKIGTLSTYNVIQQNVDELELVINHNNDED